jgi:hypothetical protein
MLANEHKLYCLAFAESVDHQWDRVIFSDKSTFSSSNDGLVLVCITQGEHYNSQYVSTSTRSGRVSVCCWSWISHEGAGIHQFIDEHLNRLQYKHILKYIMVPYVWVLYLNGVIQFQQDHFPIYASHVVQEWLSQQADVKVIDWPPCVPDMDLFENMWSEVKKTWPPSEM